MHARRLCSSNNCKEIWSNRTSTVNVCTIAVRWASAVDTTSTEVWSTTAFFSCSARRPTAGPVQKQYALDGISIFHPPPTIAQRAVCHSCKVFRSTMKGTKESDMYGQAKLFFFGFSRGWSGYQPEPNPSSAGSSEQIRKPSSSKESTSSPLEEEQRSRSQSVTICDCAQFYSRVQHRTHRRTEVSVYHALCFTEVVVKMSGTVDHEAGTHFYLKLCWRKELHDVQEMISYGWTDRAYLKFLTKIGQKLLLLDTICKKLSGGKPPDPHLPKIELPSVPLGLRPWWTYSASTYKSAWGEDPKKGRMETLHVPILTTKEPQLGMIGGVGESHGARSLALAHHVERLICQLEGAKPLH